MSPTEMDYTVMFTILFDIFCAVLPGNQIEQRNQHNK